MDTTIVACTLCGETDFYQADGHYFCNECNTQTQELQDGEAGFHSAFSGTKRVKKVSNEKQLTEKKHPLTTWECYNYILFRWVKRLIELGASKDLKESTQLLWFKYLKTIEVVHNDPNKLPNLPSHKYEKDAEIIYGVTLKKDKRKRRGNMTLNDLDLMGATNAKRHRSRLLNEAIIELHTLSDKKENDMINKSLANVQSTSVTKPLKFTKKAKKELRQTVGKTVLKKYIKGQEFPSKPSQKQNRNKNFEVLNKQKAISILYLALITIKEDIQLGDLMRLIKCGELPITNSYSLIPEEYDTSCIKEDFLNKTIPGHHNYRLNAGKMISHLKIHSIIPIQDIVSLCKRYCYELNLPEEIEEYVINLISRTKPKFPIHKSVPNYEGRAMSFIIFALKIFFSMDGFTEYKLSKFANTLSTKNMFNFNDWLNHIIYRNLVIAEHHFPTQYESKNHPQYIENYIDFKNKLLEDVEISEELYSDLWSFLDELPDEKRSPHIKFEHSLTPQTDFLQDLIDNNITESSGYLKQHLSKDFRNTSLDYLVNYKKYLEQEVEVVHHGANVAFEWTDLNIQCEFYHRMPDVLCKFVVKPKNTENINNKPEDSTILNMDKRINSFKERLKKKSGENSNQIRTNDLQDKNEGDLYKIHYLPEEMFWLCHANAQRETDYNFYKKYVIKLPETFRIVLEECGRIISHEPKEILEEYMLLEVYMCYNFHRESKCDNPSLEKLIQQAVKLW